jgi:hypothetical protein
LAAGGKDASLANLALMRRHGLGTAASYDLTFDRLVALLDAARKEGPAASAFDFAGSSLSPLSWMSRLMFPAHLLDEPVVAAPPSPPPPGTDDPFFDDPTDPDELRGQIREIFASSGRKRARRRPAG